MFQRGYSFLLRLLAAGLLLGYTVPGFAADPTPLPQPVLETGMHTAMIRRIATDRGGRWAVTASEDKTARVWDAQSGELLRVLRPPHDAGNEGKLYAVALSPDGKTVVLGGYTGGDWDGKVSIYLFDRASGEMQRRIGGLPSPVLHLAWSFAGELLAATMGSGSLHLFYADGREWGRATECETDSYSVDFRADGLRLVTTCWDGKLRLYSLTPGGMKLLREARPGGGERPYAARFSPDGRQIAVGFTDTAAVQVLDAETLLEQIRPDVGNMDKGRLGSVAWSDDGEHLYAAGIWLLAGRENMRRWRAGNWQRYQDSPLSHSPVMDMSPLPAGRLLFAAADPAWGVLDVDGQILFRRAPRGPNFNGQHDRLQVSNDGRQVRFGFHQVYETMAYFDITRISAVVGDIELRSARTAAPGLLVESWEIGSFPHVNGQTIVFNEDDVPSSLSIAPDDASFVLGTNWWLRSYDRTGKLRWQQPVPGVAWAVNHSGDGRWVVAGYADGTLRWHRADTGQEVLALFAHADRKRWVAWTPEGFYDASEGGEALMGYHLNHGRDAAGEFVAAGQLRAKFFRPGLIAQRLDGDGEERIVGAVAELGDVRAALRQPRIAVKAVEVREVEEGRVEVRATPAASEELETLLVFVDGQPRDDLRQSSWAMDGRYSGKFALAPRSEPYRVEVAALNRSGVLGPKAAATVTVSGAPRPAALHVLAVGVDKVAGAARLHFAAADARAVVDEFAKRSGKVFPRGVKVKPLINAEATAQGVERAFAEMRREFQPQDSVVLFFAGHGVTSTAGGYVFRTHDFEPGQAGREGLSEARLLALLKEAPDKTLLLLDTCAAGALADRVAKDYARLNPRVGVESSLTVIGASRSDEFAAEGWHNHGIFTAALLDALRRPGAAGDDAAVSVHEMKLYADKGMKKIFQALGKAAEAHLESFLGRDFPLLAR